MISVPGMTHEGTTYEQPENLMDIYPTLVDLTGFDKPSHLDVNSLLLQINDSNTETIPVISSSKFTYPVVFH